MFNYVIIALIVLVIPMTALLQHRYVQAKQSHVKKIKLYLLTTSLLWIITILIFQSEQRQFVWNNPLLSDFPVWMSIVIIVAVAYILITSILPYLLLKNEAFKDQFLTLFSERKHLYPITVYEKLIFIYVAMTIGITEEIIYRSFFVQFVHSLGIHSIVCILIAAAIFAVTHYIQGKEGVFQSFLFALTMSGIFVWTQHIFWPILIHILFNMRIILLSYKATQLENEIHSKL